MNRTAYVLAALLLFGAGALMGRWIEQRSATDEVTTPRKPLYYRNPMGLPDTSPVPKKDGMGMDYIPVYEGDEGGGNILRIAPEKVQKIGVRTEVA